MEVYDPGPHRSQEEEPFWEVKEPATQSVQKRLPESEYLPAGHIEQTSIVVAPNAIANLPESQSLQPSPSPSP